VKLVSGIPIPNFSYKLPLQLLIDSRGVCCIGNVVQSHLSFHWLFLQWEESHSWMISWAFAVKLPQIWTLSLFSKDHFAQNLWSLTLIIFRHSSQVYQLSLAYSVAYMIGWRCLSIALSLIETDDQLDSFSSSCLLFQHITRSVRATTIVPTAASFIFPLSTQCTMTGVAAILNADSRFGMVRMSSCGGITAFRIRVSGNRGRLDGRCTDAKVRMIMEGDL
jgi:hypothetical protein